MEKKIRPVRGDQISAHLIDPLSGEPRWSLLLPALIAGNTVVATLAWFLIGPFIK